MTKKYLNLKNILFFLIIAIIIAYYGFLYLNRPVAYIGDKFEYAYHATNLIQTGDIFKLGNFKGGISGNPSYPIYSLFPGIFYIIANFSLVTGISIFASILVLDVLFIFFLNLVLYIFIRSFNKLTKINVDRSIILFIVFSLNFLHFFYRFFLCTQLLNYFFLLCGLFLFNKYLYKELDINKIFLIQLYSLLLFPFIHHQSTIIIALFYFCFLIYYFITGNFTKLIKINYISIFFVLGLLFFYFYILIFPNINYLISVGSTIVSHVSDKTSIGSPFNNYLIIANIILPMLVVGFNIFKKYPIFLFIIFLLLAGFFQYFIIGIEFYGHRFITPLLFIISPFYLFLFKNQNKFKIINIFIVIILVVNISLNASTAIFSADYNKNINYNFLKKVSKKKHEEYVSRKMNIFSEFNAQYNKCIDIDYIKEAFVVKHKNYIPKGAKVFSDPATSFMFFKIIEVPQSYDYLRPISFSIKHYYNDIKDLAVFRFTDYNSIYKNLKQKKYEYIVYDTNITPRWSGSAEQINKQIWLTLDNYEQIEKRYSFVYKKGSSAVIIYKIKD